MHEAAVLAAQVGALVGEHHDTFLGTKALEQPGGHDQPSRAPGDAVRRRPVALDDLQGGAAGSSSDLAGVSASTARHLDGDRQQPETSQRSDQHGHDQAPVVEVTTPTNPFGQRGHLGDGAKQDPDEPRDHCCCRDHGYRGKGERRDLGTEPTLHRAGAHCCGQSDGEWDQQTGVHRSSSPSTRRRARSSFLDRPPTKLLKTCSRSFTCSKALRIRSAARSASVTRAR